jgi:hypothetical protein
MAIRQIKIDLEVWAELQRRAVEAGKQFYSPNAILRWLLQLSPKD